MAGPRRTDDPLRAERVVEWVHSIDLGPVRIVCASGEVVRTRRLTRGFERHE